MAELPGSSAQTERGGNDDVQARICWSFRSCAYCGHLECERPEPSTRKPCLNYIYCHSNSPRQTDACRRGERVYGAQHGYGGVKRRWQSGAGQDGWPVPVCPVEGLQASLVITAVPVKSNYEG